MTTIAPSVLAADFRNLEREIAKINQSSAEWIHFDVMDGVFVPNISFGFPVLEAVRSLTTKFIDVHLMIQNASKYFEDFKKAGADHITFHYEQNDHIDEDIDQLRALNLSVGLVINPDTPVSSITQYLSKIDVLLIMSVFPGFGGQKFIEGTYEKIEDLKKIIEKKSIKNQNSSRWWSEYRKL